MSTLIALAIAGGIFLLMVLILPRVSALSGGARTRNIIDEIASNSSGQDAANAAPEDEEDIVATYKAEASGLGKFLFSLPGAEEYYILLLKAGFGNEIRSVLLGMVGLFFFLTLIFFKVLGVFSIVPAAILAYIIPRFYFRRQIAKRNLKFIDMFPEAIDMIVRSVKSGHPLNTALRMIGDNMEEPIGPEFKQVINEVSYGRPLVEALRRLAKRIDEPDVHFFVVVLAVQQETGGNLAEILSNLSNVVRGRKKLSQKIRAMTSEGRATAWILGSLPVLQFCAIYFTSPDYMEPLFVTTMGNILLGIAIAMVGTAIWIINKMIDVDI